MSIFHIHFPFQKKHGGPSDIQGRRCPLVGGDDDRACGICRIWAITKQERLSCNGYNPPSVCPLAGGNDIIVSLQKKSNLILPVRN